MLYVFHPNGSLKRYNLVTKENEQQLKDSLSYLSWTVFLGTWFGLLHHSLQTSFHFEPHIYISSTYQDSYGYVANIQVAPNELHSLSRYSWVKHIDYFVSLPAIRLFSFANFPDSLENSNAKESIQTKLPSTMLDSGIYQTPIKNIENAWKDVTWTANPIQDNELTQLTDSYPSFWSFSPRFNQTTTLYASIDPHHSTF